MAEHLFPRAHLVHCYCSELRGEQGAYCPEKTQTISKGTDAAVPALTCVGVTDGATAGKPYDSVC